MGGEQHKGHPPRAYQLTLGERLESVGEAACPYSPTSYKDRIFGSSLIQAPLLFELCGGPSPCPLPLPGRFMPQLATIVARICYK